MRLKQEFQNPSHLINTILPLCLQYLINKLSPFTDLTHAWFNLVRTVIYHSFMKNLIGLIV